MGAPDEARKICLLEFFIDHFVAMAKESNRKKSYGQGLMYVMQAENLLQLLGEEKLCISQINIVSKINGLVLNSNFTDLSRLTTRSILIYELYL